MYRVRARHIPSVQCALADTEYQHNRLAMRTYPRSFPGMREPKLTDELCAWPLCTHRVFSDVTGNFTGITEEPGLKYCSAECATCDIHYRDTMLCARCKLYIIVDHRAVLPCKKPNLCDHCLASSPCFCMLCRRQYKAIPLARTDPNMARSLTPEVVCVQQDPQMRSSV